MERVVVIEAVALYWPLCLAVFLALLLRPSARERAAIAMASTWQAASLALLNALAQQVGWWRFSESAWSVLGMPLSLYLGWVILWGVVAVLLLRRFGVAITVVILVVFDVLAMPLMQPVLELSGRWLVGEWVCIFMGLVPGMLLARWVIEDQHAQWRAWLISIAFVGLVMVVLPVIGSRGEVMVYAVGMSVWMAWSMGAVLFFVGLPALAAVIEFAREGRGTPIPFDPPKRLVVTGVYSYISNPMQISMCWVLLLGGVFFQHWIFLMLAAVSVIYSEGIARWSEGEDMKKRYGKKWEAYRRVVPRWRLSLIPQFPDDMPKSKLYYEVDCEVCNDIGQWFIRHSPEGMTLEPASNYQRTRLKRITYVSSTGEEVSGVLAIAAALQNIHLGWAMFGWLLQLPGVSHIAQLAMDASGAAPAKGG